MGTADLYLFGGETTSGLQNQAYRMSFRLATSGGCANPIPPLNCWTPIAPMPHPRAQHEALAAPDGRIYVMGGRSNAFNTMDIYDPATDTWQTTAFPTVVDFAAAVIDNRIYVAGGQTIGFVGGVPTLVPSADAFYYDISTGSMTNLPNLPTPRYGVSGIAVRSASSPVTSYFYALGGTDGSTTYATVEAYDPVLNIWTTETPLPAPRRYGDVVPDLAGYTINPPALRQGALFIRYIGGLDPADMASPLEFIMGPGLAPSPNNTLLANSARSHHEVEAFDYFTPLPTGHWYLYNVWSGSGALNAQIPVYESNLRGVALPDDRLQIFAEAEPEVVRLQGNISEPETVTEWWFERSWEGNPFEPLHTYQDLSQSVHYLDRQPGAQHLSYRLAARTQDGSTVYSDAVEVSLAGHLSLRIAPNPTVDRLRIMLGGVDLDAPLEWQLRGMEGRLLGEGSGKWNGSGQEMDLSEFPAGIYFLRVTAGGHTWTRKVIRD